MKLEGLPRHASTHAAGVVIGDRPLDELVPLYRDPRSDMPVTQFDMKYVEAAGLVKFDFLGLKTLSVLKEGQRLLAEQGVEVDFDALPWDDPAVYELLQRGDTVGVFQLESEGMRRTLAGGPPDRLRRHHRARRALPPGADGQHPDVRRPQERPRADRISASAARRHPRRDLRHLRLPGTGDAGGADARRLLARRSRSAAPRDGQEDPVGDGRPARALRRGLRDAQPDPRGQGQRAVRHDRQVRRLRLQQEPRRGLCAGRLPDRLAEGASPRRILRRVDELRHGADRQARHLRRGHAPRRGRVPAARHQRQPRSFHRRGWRASAMRWARSRASARRRWRRWSRSASAAGRSPASRISRRGSIRGCSTAASSKALPAAGAFDPHQARTGRRCSPRPRRSSPMPRAPTTSATSGQAGLFGANSAEAAPIRLPRDASWTLAQRMAAERDAFGFYFSAHPVDAARHLLAAHKVRTFAELAELSIAEGERAGATMAALVEGVALARVGQGPALHDRQPVGPLRAVRGDGVRRRARRARSKRPPRRAPAAC